IYRDRAAFGGGVGELRCNRVSRVDARRVRLRFARKMCGDDFLKDFVASIAVVGCRAKTVPEKLLLGSFAGIRLVDNAMYSQWMDREPHADLEEYVGGPSSPVGHA